MGRCLASLLINMDHFEMLDPTQATDLSILEDQVNEQLIELQKLSAGILWLVFCRSDWIIIMAHSNPKLENLMRLVDY